MGSVTAPCNTRIWTWGLGYTKWDSACLLSISELNAVLVCAHLFALDASQVLQAVGACLLPDSRQQLCLDGAQGVALPAGGARPPPRLVHRRQSPQLTYQCSQPQCLGPETSQQACAPHCRACAAHMRVLHRKGCCLSGAAGSEMHINA